jgi:hypothetical protein
MSKKDAYNFLSGISLTNIPKPKEKNNTKSALRESQTGFVSPVRKSPTIKTTHRFQSIRKNIDQ